MRICDTAIRKKRPSESLESGFSDGLLMGAFKPFAAWLTQNGNRLPLPCDRCGKNRVRSYAAHVTRTLMI